MPDAQVRPADSYYGRPVVKAPPWGPEIPAYLFLGGLAGGSGVIAAGAQATGRAVLRRNARLTALTAIGIGSAALVKDLGRPERFLNMLRTFKPTSPMSMGSWFLAAYGAGIAPAALAEIDRLTGRRLPVGPVRGVLGAVEAPAGVAAGLLGPPLAAYTAVLLSDTAVPTWNGARDGLPFVFVGSATMAAAGAAMVTTPAGETGPVRVLAVLGAAADVAATRLTERSMDPVLAEPLHTGRPGALLRWSERLAVAGALGAALGGSRRPVAAASGLALAGASALTRFGIVEAGIASTKDPRYTLVPQRRRLEARRAAGVVHDSVTTA